MRHEVIFYRKTDVNTSRRLVLSRLYGFNFLKLLKRPGVSIQKRTGNWLQSPSINRNGVFWNILLERWPFQSPGLRTVIKDISLFYDWSIFNELSSGFFWENSELCVEFLMAIFLQDTELQKTSALTWLTPIQAT